MAALQLGGVLTREISTTYHDAAPFSAKLGNKKLALLWTEKELEIGWHCVSEDHPHCKKELEAVSKIRAATENCGPFDQSIVAGRSLMSTESWTL
ncbi:hypothetical protein K432DRAFT_429377 [Lepidopterella palustris CBS 459.81]|uniref:Uncharacterized protein n=1 Tax=Lepidopterella palustris CBS 459.81 TaxID=1314670 RepID=A0A8E2JAJ2_9PEZI|nr:hypothetical protein K432DRAFT_429377 [Lepidopterella palustris CBS 459.81]